MAFVLSPSKALRIAAAFFTVSLLCSGPAVAKAKDAPLPEVVEWVTQAEAARAAGDYRTAEAKLRAAYARQPLPVIMNNLGKLLEEEGRYLAAIEAYRLVTENQAASVDLRSLDRARLGALEPKALKAWVRAPASLPWDWVRVSGTSVPLDDTVEVGVPPGEGLVEIGQRGEPDLLSLRLQRFVRGRRLTLKADGPPMGTLRLGSLKPPPEAISVDGHRVTGYTVASQGLRVVPGPHEMRLESRSGKQIRVTVTVPGDGAADLAQWAQVPWGTIHAASKVGPAPGLSPDASRLLKVVGVSLGAVLTGTGLYLNHDVEQSREFILNPERSPDLTMREASDQWELLNTRSMIGGTLTGLGSALVMGGVVWWWLDDDTPAVSGDVSVHPWPETGPLGGPAHSSLWALP